MAPDPPNVMTPSGSMTSSTPTPFATPSLLTAQDLAQLLQVSVRTIWRLRENGSLPPPISIGTAIRWRADEVQQWIENGCPTVFSRRGNRRVASVNHNEENNRC